MNMLRRTCLTAALLATLPLSARAEDGYGDLTGQFVLDGAIPKPALLHKKGDPTVKDGAVCAADDVFGDDLVVDEATKGIANVFVYLTAKDGKAVKLHPSLKESAVKELVFDQKGCVFTPHAMFIRADQQVIVKSDDAIAHNTHTYTVKNDAVNFLVPPKERKGIPIKFTDSETVPMPVKCDIHPWMRARWLILEHPFAAVTDSKGKFKIEKLPEGDYKFRVWHERAGYLNREWAVSVKSGKATDGGVVKVPVDKVSKPAE